MLFTMLSLPFADALSDRIGRRPTWRWSLIGLLLLVVPLYMLIGTGLTGAVVAFMALGLLYVPQRATIFATFAVMLPTAVFFAGLRSPIIS